MKTNKSIRTEIVIHASKEKVWNILVDTKNYSIWNPFIVSMEGEIKEGSKLVNVMKNGGSTITFKPKVLKVIPNTYFEWLGHLWIPGLFDGRHYFELSDAGDGYVKLTQEEEFSGLLATMVLKKIGEDTKQNFILMNAALKNLAESKDKNE